MKEKIARLVGASVDIARVPISDAVNKLTEPKQAVNWALSGGDDYQLCFTVPAEKLELMESLIENEKVQATAIGEITAGSGITCTSGDKVIAVAKSGYQHFENGDP